MFLVVFLVIFNLTHYVSLGSLALYVGFVVLLIVEASLGVFSFDIMPFAAKIEMYLIAIIMAVLAFWRHRSNIVKLMNGTERKTYIFKKNKVD